MLSRFHLCQIYCLIVCIVLTTLCLSGLGVSMAQAQQSSLSATYYRVFFRDKGSEPFQVGSALYERTLRLHSERALARRRNMLAAQGLPADRVITLEDAPVYQPYIDSISRFGTVVQRLRWQNYIVVQLDASRAARVQQFPFVRAVQPTSARLLPLERGTTPSATAVRQIQEARSAAMPYQETVVGAAVDASTLFAQNQETCGAFVYRTSQEQLQSINIPAVHALGFTGKGVLMGFADSGFRWRGHVAFQHLRVLGEYNAIANDSSSFSTANNPQYQDPPNQDDHGTLVLSSVAGFDNRTFIGGAPFVDVLLAKTEDLRFERLIELDNYAAGMEWMESRGADIINSSLGYTIFDSTIVPQESYRYAEFDGKTTIAARAVNAAAARGVLCVVSAGNDGPNFRTLNTPGDADSAVTVASIRADGTVSRTSSRGPLATGRIKPDIAAQGERVTVALTGTTAGYRLVDGTSFSSPLVASAAALMMEAFPELLPYQLTSLLYATASRRAANLPPDSITGNGTANALAAMLRHGIALSPSITAYPVYNALRVVTAARSASERLTLTLHVQFAGSTEFRVFPMQSISGTALFVADIPNDLFRGSSTTAVARCYVTAQDERSTRRSPYTPRSTAPNAAPTFALTPSLSTFACGLEQERLPFTFSESGIVEGVRPSLISRSAAQGEATLMMFTPTAGTLTMTVYSLLGQPVVQETREVSAGLTNLPFPTHHLPRGLYAVSVAYNGTIRRFSFMVRE